MERRSSLRPAGPLTNPEIVALHNQQAHANAKLPGGRSRRQSPGSEHKLPLTPSTTTLASPSSPPDQTRDHLRATLLHDLHHIRAEYERCFDRYRNVYEAGGVTREAISADDWQDLRRAMQSYLTAWQERGTQWDLAGFGTERPALTRPHFQFPDTWPESHTYPVSVATGASGPRVAPDDNWQSLARTHHGDASFAPLEHTHRFDGSGRDDGLGAVKNHPEGDSPLPGLLLPESARIEHATCESQWVIHIHAQESPEHRTTSERLVTGMGELVAQRRRLAKTQAELAKSVTKARSDAARVLWQADLSNVATAMEQIDQRLNALRTEWESMGLRDGVPCDVGEVLPVHIEPPTRPAAPQLAIHVVPPAPTSDAESALAGAPKTWPALSQSVAGKGRPPH